MAKRRKIDNLHVDLRTTDDLVMTSAHGPIELEDAGEEGVKVFAPDGRQLAALHSGDRGLVIQLFAPNTLPSAGEN